MLVVFVSRPSDTNTQRRLATEPMIAINVEREGVIEQGAIGPLQHDRAHTQKMSNKDPSISGVSLSRPTYRHRSGSTIRPERSLIDALSLPV